MYEAFPDPEETDSINKDEDSERLLAKEEKVGQSLLCAGEVQMSQGKKGNSHNGASGAFELFVYFLPIYFLLIPV